MYSAAVLTATQTFFPVAVATFKMLAPVDVMWEMIAARFVVQSWHWNNLILLSNSRPVCPKLVPSIVSKYGSSSARTVPEINKTYLNRVGSLDKSINLY